MGFGRFFIRQTAKSITRTSARRRLNFDTLEDRLVMTVSLATIAPPPVLTSKHTYVPLVATDTNGRRLSEPKSSQLSDGLIGQGPGTRNDTYTPFLMYMAGHDTDLAFAR